MLQTIKNIFNANRLFRENADLRANAIKDKNTYDSAIGFIQARLRAYEVAKPAFAPDSYITTDDDLPGLTKGRPYEVISATGSDILIKSDTGQIRIWKDADKFRPSTPLEIDRHLNKGKLVTDDPEFQRIKAEVERLKRNKKEHKTTLDKLVERRTKLMHHGFE